MVYQTALLDWVDDATFGSPDKKQELSEAIATLWVEYANLNRKANLVKAATEAFESAVNCPVAGSSGKIWSEYAKFQRERNRNKTAQKIYIQALVGENGQGGQVIDGNERYQLWLEFLDMMKKINQDESLTLEQLQEAVEVEQVATNRDTSNSSTANATAAAMTTTSGIIDPHASIVKTEPLMDNQSHIQDNLSQPLTKRAKVQETSLLSSATVGNNFPAKSQLSSSSIEAYACEISMKVAAILPEITAEWMARDGNSLPSVPPVPLFSPSPPRLSDPSGKEMLGTEISLKLIRMLLGSVNSSGDGGEVGENLDESEDDNIIADTLLDVCKACWVMTALKEKEASMCTEALDQKLLDDVQRMDTDLEARLSVAGAALAAVQQINANEKHAFVTTCNQQRQHMQALIVWEFRQLLATQQQILTDAGLPEFHGPTIDSVAMYKQSMICSFLHSAFYLRSRIGEKAHVAMLKSQEARLRNQPVTPMPLPVEPMDYSSLSLAPHQLHPQQQQQQYNLFAQNYYHMMNSVPYGGQQPNIQQYQ